MCYTAVPWEEGCQLPCFMGLCGPHGWSTVHTLRPLSSPPHDDSGNGVPAACSSADHGNVR